MSELKYDKNWAPQLLAAGITPPSDPVDINGVLKTIIANLGGSGGSGTVTSVSVVSANGVAGTVATPTTTAAITLSTTITGLLKGNGTAISAAAAGTDYVGPTSGSAIQKASAGGLTAATAGTDYPATGVIAAAGPVGSSIAVPVLTYNANGQLTTVSTTGTVGSVTAADSSIVIAGTGTAPTVQRAALTGDVTASAGSNATAIAAIQGVAISGTPSSGQAIIATSPTAAAWSTFGGGAPTGSAGGDLSGTYPNPGVAQVHGVAISAAEATLVSQLNGATTRSASASAVAGEQTVLTGTTASQTLTLPASTAQVSSPNLVINNSTQNWTIAFGSGTTGNRFGVAGSFNLNAGSFVEFYLIGTVWYMTRYSLAPPQTFTSGTPTWIPSGTGNAQFTCLLVAGGGAGQAGGSSTAGIGGGGGEVLSGFSLGNVTANQTVTIGAGGTSGGAGNNSSIGALLAAGAGQGGNTTFVNGAAGDGTLTATTTSGFAASGAGGLGGATSGTGGKGGPGFLHLGVGGGGGGGPTSAAGGSSGGSVTGDGAGGTGTTNGGGGGGAWTVNGQNGTSGQGGHGGAAPANSGGGGGGGGAGTAGGASGAGGSGIAVIFQGS